MLLGSLLIVAGRTLFSEPCGHWVGEIPKKRFLKIIFMPRTFKLILMATGIFSRNFLESLYQGPASPKPIL